ncbi:MAG: molybdopterin-dependent oxidoreductase [Deltaproteobacteria bacterium]|nr:molybdopterin-dependent oxidoreductase [Deltaproteobacteria bacterium]
MSSENTIIINGQDYPFNTGEMILNVAERNGIFIPTLCFLKGATPTGACRMCLVEVEGARTLVASCATPAAPGMVVRTETARVIKSRRLNLELLLSSGDHNCLVRDMGMDSWTDFQLRAMDVKEHQDLCPSYGNCSLQDLAIRYRVKTSRYTPTDVKYPVENVNPYIVRDFSRCILCGRCVQACNEIQVNNAISHGYRGSQSKIVAKGDRALKDSDCVFCGECVQACPVGALVPVRDFSLTPAQAETGKIRTTCSYCGVGCQLYLHVRDQKVIRVTGVEGVEPNRGSLCRKGRFEFDFINDEGRLKTPLIKNNGKFEEASWDKALCMIADRFKKIITDAGPDSIGMLCSANITNEELYAAQKFMRAAVGTNNIDSFSSLCDSSTVPALTGALGIGAMTNPIEDIEKSDVILIAGSDTTDEHPVLSSFVKRAVAFKGAELIVADPEKINMTRFAAIHLKPKSGTDAAWINALIHTIINEKLYDEEYVSSRTSGIEELKKKIVKYTPEYAESVTGISRDQLFDAARRFAKAKAPSIIYAAGITRQAGGISCVKSLVNLAMLCGNPGESAGGLNPLAGQSNCQGAFDMGCMPDYFSGYQKVADESVRKEMEKLWGSKSLSANPGMRAAEMLEKAQTGQLKALFLAGEILNGPDDKTKAVIDNSNKLELLVVQDIFLSENASLADVVLPAASFAEKDGTFTNMERSVQRVRKSIDPRGDARAAWEVFCELSSLIGYPMNYENAEAVMKEIANVTPFYRGINYKRIENNRICWPCPDIDHPGTPRLHSGKFSGGPGVFDVSDY